MLKAAVERASVIDYSVRTYAIMFFAYSFVGKVWEIILFLAVEQELVSTGLLHGPWLPMYGVGGVLSLELLKRFRSSPAKTFVLIMIVSGILEYAAHALSERIFGVTWWDYSDYLLNINGRICIEGLIVFAILGCVSIYVIAPKVNNAVSRINIKNQNYLILILSAAFVLDICISLISPNMNNIY